MITFKWECPEIHEPYTAARKIVHEMESEASLDELCDSFVDFLRGVGYTIPEHSHIEFVNDDESEEQVYPVREDIPAELWGKPIVKAR